MNPLLAFSDALEALVARVTPAVVGVEHGRGHGSGFVLTQDGYVVTNQHVVGSGRGIRIRFADGRRPPAEVVGLDAPSDLAVLRVDGGRLPTLPLLDGRDGRSLAVGQLVVAVGNPFGFERSVSVGIVSAVERSLPGPGGAFEGLVQTDAAINPGNSGGPLVNAHGEVVGINTAVIPSAQGLGFAIHARTVSWVASVLMQKGEVRRRYLGIAARSVQLEGAGARELGQARAVLVEEVAPDSPARAAGVEARDHVLALDGEPIGSVDDLHRLMVLKDLSELELEVWRKGARTRLKVAPRQLPRAA